MLIHRGLTCNIETKKLQSTNDKEDNMLAVSSCTIGAKNFIQAQTIFAHELSNILGELYSKANDEQNIIAEEYLKNNIILDSGSSIDIFSNNQLLPDINTGNQLLHLCTNVVSKMNQMQAMVP